MSNNRVNKKAAEDDRPSDTWEQTWFSKFRDADKPRVKQPPKYRIPRLSDSTGGRSKPPSPMKSDNGTGERGNPPSPMKSGNGTGERGNPPSSMKNNRNGSVPRATKAKPSSITQCDAKSVIKRSFVSNETGNVNKFKINVLPIKKRPVTNISKWQRCGCARCNV